MPSYKILILVCVTYSSCCVPLAYALSVASRTSLFILSGDPTSDIPAQCKTICAPAVSAVNVGTFLYFIFYHSKLASCFRFQTIPFSLSQQVASFGNLCNSDFVLILNTMIFYIKQTCQDTVCFCTAANEKNFQDCINCVLTVDSSPTAVSEVQSVITSEFLLICCGSPLGCMLCLSCFFCYCILYAHSFDSTLSSFVRSPCSRGYIIRIYTSFFKILWQEARDFLFSAAVLL